MTNLKTMIEKEFTFEPYDFDKTEICGIPLHIKHFSSAPCVHIRIVFHYGAMHDDVGKEGTSHFLEHMLFKGNDIYLDEKSIKNFSKDVLLGTFNAHTNIFELVMKGKCLPHNFQKAIEGIFATIYSSKLTKEAHAQEQKVIIQEAWKKFLNEKHIQYVRKYRSIRFPDLPHRIRTGSALGWPETIAHITLEDIINAYKKFFVKENIEIILAGNINALGTIDDIKEILTREVSKIPNGKKAESPFIPKDLKYPTQHIFEHTFTEIGLTEKSQTELSISYTLARKDKNTGVPNTESENFFVAIGATTAQLVRDIIFEKLRIEQSWCYSAGATFDMALDYCRFNMGSFLNPGYSDEAIEISKNILTDIKKGQYRDKFEQRKRLLIEFTIASENTTADIVDTAVSDLILSNGIIKEKVALLLMEKVQFEDVQKFIEECLTSERELIEISRPTENKA